MSEAIDTLKKYFCEEMNTVHYHGDDAFVTQMADALYRGEIIEYEAPDLYIKLENVVWVLEHFEFDCSRSNRKGSAFKKEESRVIRAEEKIKPTNQGTLFHDKIVAESSYDDYVKNVIKNFKSHYVKIGIYKQNLIKDRIADENTIFKVIFLIDDVSILGASCIDDKGDWIPIILAHCREFLDLLEDSSMVDGVLAFSSCDDKKLIWFIDRYQLKDYSLNAEDYNSFKFMKLMPNVLEYTIAVPKEFVRENL